MAPTPQITLRVDTETKDKWKAVCAEAETSVSEQLRTLMEEWVERQLANPA